MSQEEVISILEKHKEPISRAQIAKELNDDPVKISKALARLIYCGEVKCIELDRYKAAELLGLKHPRRRTRFYYI